MDVQNASLPCRPDHTRESSVNVGPHASRPDRPHTFLCHILRCWEQTHRNVGRRVIDYTSFCTIALAGQMGD